jgi:hypothetical protein
VASGLIAAAGNDACSDGDGFAAEAGIIALLDGGEEGIDIEVEDEGAVVGAGCGG